MAPAVFAVDRTIQRSGLELGNPMSNPNISVVVVVNTEDVTVDNVNPNAPVSSLAERALNKSESKERPLSDFDLKDATGAEINLSAKVGEAGITDGAKLYLALKAGITG
jgi:hypothetical protein